MFKKALVAAAALATSIALAAPASADTVSLSSADVGSSFTVLFDGNVNTVNIPDLTSQATFTLDSIAGNTWNFSVDVAVTATNGVGARVSSLGFDTDPSLASASSSGMFDRAVLGGSYPNQFGSIDVCFKGGGGPNNCQGGGSGGTYTTGSFTAALTFGSPVSNLDLSNFGVRYQSITGVATCGNSTDCTSGTGMGTVSVVPEPATWSLLIVAFGLLSWQVRRRVTPRAA